ncbi:30 kDa heat shock protein [Xylaria sp. CBS 124048]|nr:30 kDa heat shock protein [Xylaria sp. CBS 124048]
MSIFTYQPFYTVPNSGCGHFDNSLAQYIDNLDVLSCLNMENTQRAQQSRPAHRSTSTFTPRFDVMETEESYKLYGELPGAEKRDVTVEFKDTQTIVVRGHSERNYEGTNVPFGTIDHTVNNGIANNGIANKPHSEGSETRSNKSFQATVEDETDYDYVPVASTRTTTPVEEPPKPRTSQARVQSTWIYERSVGDFQRSFAFKTRIDAENATASLENGLLTVVIPKVTKHSRIVVQ